VRPLMYIFFFLNSKNSLFVKYCFLFWAFFRVQTTFDKKIEISGWTVRFYRILIWQIVFCKFVFFVCLGGYITFGGTCSYSFLSSYFKSQVSNFSKITFLNISWTINIYIHTYFFKFTLDACNLNQVWVCFTLAK